jgi:hypothetical protein
MTYYIHFEKNIKGLKNFTKAVEEFDGSYHKIRMDWN